MVAATGARARARELRLEGWSVNDLAVEFGVARSTAWRWVGDLPLDRGTERARHKREQGRRATAAYWDGRRLQLHQHIESVRALAAESVSELGDRDLRLLGAIIYWCEGKKAKSWRPIDRVVFVNGDLRLIMLFLRFLSVMEIGDDQVFFRLYIHESADVASCEAWWARCLGASADRFKRTVLKRHNPQTRRRNAGTDYHGCLAVEVARSRDLYWRIEGIVARVFEGSAMCGT